MQINHVYVLKKIEAIALNLSVCIIAIIWKKQKIFFVFTLAYPNLGDALFVRCAAKNYKFFKYLELRISKARLVKKKAKELSKKYIMKYLVFTFIGPRSLVR